MSTQHYASLFASFLALFAVNAVFANDAPTTTSYIGDSAFVDKAAKGGMAEVKLSELALKNTDSLKVRTFANKMVKDHTSVNEKLTAIAKANSLKVPDGLEPTAQKAYDEMAHKKGTDFDAAYCTQMLNDHEKTVALFRSAAANAKARDLRDFARDTLPQLESHRDMAKELHESVQQ